MVNKSIKNYFHVLLNNMKRGLNVNISLSNKATYTIISIFVFLIAGVGVYAFGGSDPTFVGHTAGELDLSSGVNGDAIFNGNVGIGTSSPIYNLQIGDNTKGIELAIGGPGGLHLIRLEGEDGFNYGYAVVASQTNNGGIYSSGELHLAARTDAGGRNINFWTGNPGVNRMVVSSSGNVGIGTITPTEKLDIIGNIKSSGTICDSVGCIGSGSGSGIPSGAVMAFNLASCPTGWIEMVTARGKTIVGLDPGQAEFDTQGETGGEINHVLTEAEMPSHTHTVNAGGPFVDQFGAHSGGSDPSTYAPGTASESTGGNQPHNNLQPYIALIYCQKN